MVKKSTHDEYRTELFMPIIKRRDGRYIAVLSDNSTDRDEEKISKDCIEKLGHDDGYLAALCNHKNDVFMQVAEWTNRGVEEIEGYTALIAEPKFYKSNPNSKTIKGMLDEGAKIGVSIGAIVKDYDEIDGMKIFTDLELLEASFVAVPSNRHGRAMAVAKSYNRKLEGTKMDKEFTQKDIDSAVDKKIGELESVHKTALESKDTEISKLKKEAEDAVSAKKEAEKAVDTAKEDAKTAEKKAEGKLKDAEKKIKEVEKKALEKQRFADQGGDPDAGLSSDDVDKAFKDGKLPVMVGRT